MLFVASSGVVLFCLLACDLIDLTFDDGILLLVSPIKMTFEVPFRFCDPRTCYMYRTRHKVIACRVLGCWLLLSRGSQPE